MRERCVPGERQQGDEARASFNFNHSHRMSNRLSPWLNLRSWSIISNLFQSLADKQNKFNRSLDFSLSSLISLNPLSLSQPIISLSAVSLLAPQWSISSSLLSLNARLFVDFDFLVLLLLYDRVVDYVTFCGWFYEFFGWYAFKNSFALCLLFEVLVYAIFAFSQKGLCLASRRPTPRLAPRPQQNFAPHLPLATMVPSQMHDTASGVSFWAWLHPSFSEHHCLLEGSLDVWMEQWHMN